MPEEFRLAIDNELLEISRLCAECEEFLERRGVAPAAIYAANLVLEEMITNIVKYGYDDMARHKIQTALRVDGGMVTIVLEDDGHAFDPLAAPPPDVRQPLENRPIGGLGIHLARKMAESMEYRRAQDRNILTINIRANQSPASAGISHGNEN